MVVVYRLAPLTYRLGKPFVHVQTYAMVESRGRTARRSRADSGRIHAGGGRRGSVARADRSATRRRACARICADVTARLGGAGASRRAAEEVLAVARHHHSTTR